MVALWHAQWRDCDGFKIMNNENFLHGTPWNADDDKLRYQFLQPKLFVGPRNEFTYSDLKICRKFKPFLRFNSDRAYTFPNQNKVANVYKVQYMCTHPDLWLPIRSNIQQIEYLCSIVNNCDMFNKSNMVYCKCLMTLMCATTHICLTVHIYI